MRAFWVLLFVAVMAAALAAKLSPRAPAEMIAWGVRLAPAAHEIAPFIVEQRGRAAELAAPPAKPAASPAEPPETEITIVLAGDTGLNGSYQPVFASFGTKRGERMTWADATANTGHLLGGDVNFANLETVVTDRNDLKPDIKLFAFRTHPDGVRHLVRSGLNLFSTANNHAMDFGPEGVRETVKHLGAIGVAHAGVGLDRGEARAPRIVWTKNRAIALGALGIIGNAYSSPRENEKRPGQLSYAGAGDMDEVVAELTAAKADYRILSVHYGQELEVNTSQADRRRLTGALAGGADLVVGHHHHVVAGIEIVNGKPVFYGLGNFMHWGMQDMGRFDVCRNYGLLTRVHLSARADEPLTLRAIEAVPLTNMHRATRALEGDEARAKVHVLNHLAEQFGANGVRFKAEPSGAGLYCAPGTEKREGELARRCRVAKLDPPAPKLAEQIRAACGRRIVRVVENETGLVPIFAPEDEMGGAVPLSLP